MAWLTRIVAAFLVAALCVAVIASVFDHTVFSSHYIEKQASQTNAYPRLSVALSAELAKDAGTADPQLNTSLQKVLAPDALQQKINSALDQLEAYYKGHGSAPTIDLTSFVTQAQAAGLPVPADNPLNKPIVLAGNAQTKGVSKEFETVKTASMIAAVLAFIALLVLSWERHRYAIVPDIAIECGLLLGIVAAVFILVPSTASRYIKFNFNSNAFAAIGHDLVISIAKDLGRTFATVAIVLFVVGVVGRILVAVLKPKTAKPASTLRTPSQRQPKRV